MEEIIMRAFNSKWLSGLELLDSLQDSNIFVIIIGEHAVIHNFFIIKGRTQVIQNN